MTEFENINFKALKIETVKLLETQDSIEDKKLGDVLNITDLTADVLCEICDRDGSAQIVQEEMGYKGLRKQ